MSAEGWRLFWRRRHAKKKTAKRALPFFFVLPARPRAGMPWGSQPPSLYACYRARERGERLHRLITTHGGRKKKWGEKEMGLSSERLL